MASIEVSPVIIQDVKRALEHPGIVWHDDDQAVLLIGDHWLWVVEGESANQLESLFYDLIIAETIPGISARFTKPTIIPGAPEQAGMKLIILQRPALAGSVIRERHNEGRYGAQLDALAQQISETLGPEKLRRLYVTGVEVGRPLIYVMSAHGLR